MTDKPTTEPSPEIESLYAKLSAEGPIALDDAEANQLRAAFQEMLLRVAQLEATNRVNVAMAQALQRQGFVMKSELNPDGTVSWDLQYKTDPLQDGGTVN